MKGGENRELLFENIPLSAIVVWKFDSVTKTAITGAEFQVRYLGGTSGTGGTAIGNYKTGANGAFTVTGLKGGTYVVEEVSSDANHVIDTAPQTVLIIFGNKPLCNLTIQKRVSLTKKPLAGAQFLVTDQAGLPIGPSGGHFTTGSSGLVTVTGIRPDTAVTVREEKAPSGYVLNTEPQTITVKSNEDNIHPAIGVTPDIPGTLPRWRTALKTFPVVTPFSSPCPFSPLSSFMARLYLPTCPIIRTFLWLN